MGIFEHYNHFLKISGYEIITTYVLRFSTYTIIVALLAIFFDFLICFWALIKARNVFFQTLQMV
jgi:hypothetical protein